MKRLLLAALLTVFRTLASSAEPEFLVRMDGASGGFTEIRTEFRILPDGSVSNGARVAPEDLARLPRMLDRLIELGGLSRGGGSAPTAHGSCVDPATALRINCRKDGGLYSGNLHRRLMDRVLAQDRPGAAQRMREPCLRGAAGLIGRLTRL